MSSPVVAGAASLADLAEVVAVAVAPSAVSGEASPAHLAGVVTIGVASLADAGAASLADAGMAFPADLAVVVTVGVAYLVDARVASLADAGMAFPADHSGVVTVGVAFLADGFGTPESRIDDLAESVRHRCDGPDRCWIWYTLEKIGPGFHAGIRLPAGNDGLDLIRSPDARVDIDTDGIRLQGCDMEEMKAGFR